MADRRDLREDVKVSRVAGDYSSSGDNAVISAPGSGSKLVILGYEMQATGTVNAKLQDTQGTPVQLSPLYRFQAREGAVAVGSLDAPLFELGDNLGLEINLSAAVAVALAVTYVTRAV